MADIWSAEKRSEVMSRIRGGNTRPELLVRSMLHRHGYRFTIHGPKNKNLPGKPDLVLPKLRIVIFVHGCFWHGHEDCPDFRLPKSRVEWWTAKINGNRARDERVQTELVSLGWHVVTLWACGVKTAASRKWLETQLHDLLGPPPRRVISRYRIPEIPAARVAEDHTRYAGRTITGIVADQDGNSEAFPP